MKNYSIMGQYQMNGRPQVAPTYIHIINITERMQCAPYTYFNCRGDLWSSENEILL